MRVLHLADLHLLLRGPRSGECRRILDWIAEHAADERPDAIIISGDVFDRLSTPDDREYLADWLGLIAGDASMVFAIRGNHDHLIDQRLFNRFYHNVRIVTEPEVTAGGGVVFAFLPWPDLGRVAASMGPSASIADRRDGTRAALIDILRGFRADPGLQPGMPSLLVSHLQVLGASVDSGQPVASGNEIGFPADELLECGAAGAALGHIHLRQQMRSRDGRPVWYAGAPFRTTFGEATGGKGGLLWEWKGDRWRVEPWDVPARRMLLVEADLEFDTPEDGGGASLVYLNAELDERGEAPTDVADAEVRLRAHFAPEHRETAMGLAEQHRREMLRSGAFSVVVDPQPLMVQRTRCAEISSARTTGEKVAAWARTAGLEVPAGAVEKLVALETEVGP